ncbi:MAG: 4-(cytidine 5'-diphospho)-2-C-methyl-D-erythritol kinase [Bacteroidales bacterium]|jgi:4-diphosphocytidyl-2-C-methyl-D-erythritol kinase
MICYPNAKINLGLAVTEKRADGFHHIETCFYPIPLCDVLEFVESTYFDLAVFGNQSDVAVEDNILTKVWQLFHHLFHIPPVKVALLKAIPTGAGLGGGSADAAFFMKGLNDLFALKLSNAEMEQLSVTLGSDCPFFIENLPAIGRGKGEVLTQIPFSLVGYYLTVVFPTIFISTAKAFQQIVPRFPEISISKILEQPPINWKNSLINDFQSVAMTMHPVIETTIVQLYEAGAVYASLSGSGSAMYALSEKPLVLNQLPKNFMVYSWKL